MLTKKDLHLRDYLKVIKKHRRIAWTFFVATLAIVLIATFAVTPQYEATAKIIIAKGESSDLTGPGDRYRRSSYNPEFYQTQFQLIKSYAVSRRVVDLLGLAKSSTPVPGMESGKLGAWIKKEVEGVKKVLGIEGRGENAVSPKRSRADRIAEMINQGLHVRLVENTRIVHISFMSPNPEFAALVANTVVQAYMEETLDMKMESTRWNLAWMTKKSGAEQQKLNKAEKALQQYMKANDIVTLENGATVTPDKLSELNIQLVRAETKRQELETLNRQVQRVANDPQAAETVSAISSDKALQALREQIVESEKNIMELSGKYGPKHPVMIKALGDLRVLKEKRNQEIARIVQSIHNQYELALSNERDLRAALGHTKAQALRLNEKLVQYNALKRDVDTNRQLYDALMLKIKEQSITQEAKPIQLWVMEKAAVPIIPARPMKGLNLLLGLILGSLGGIGLVFFVEYLDNTIKEPEQAEEILGAPVLGVVSLCKEKDRRMEEVVMEQPQSAFAESYSALRTALLFCSAERAPKKILISSAAPREGKTTTSVNLALSLAKSGKRVVLIDGDLRKPSLHKIFKMSNERGLSSFLAGAPGNDILKSGSLPNLSLVTSGPIPPNPSELLSSNRMKALIEDFCKEFDMVICDSPPLLSVSDCKMLCGAFDGTVLVARAHQTTYDIASRALKALRDVKTRVFGVVINGLDLKKGGYYHYEYMYSYGTQAEAPKKVMVRGG